MGQGRSQGILAKVKKAPKKQIFKWVDSFQDYDYEMKELLGKGNYGSVKKAQNKLTGDSCAIKIIQKSTL